MGIREVSSPMRVGLIQPVESLSRRERLRGNSLYLTAFKLAHCFPPGPSLRLKLTPLALLVLRPLDLDGSYTISSPGSPAHCRS